MNQWNNVNEYIDQKRMWYLSFQNYDCILSADELLPIEHIWYKSLIAFSDWLDSGYAIIKKEGLMTN